MGVVAATAIAGGAACRDRREHRASGLGVARRGRGHGRGRDRVAIDSARDRVGVL